MRGKWKRITSCKWKKVKDYHYYYYYYYYYYYCRYHHDHHHCKMMKRIKHEVIDLHR
jgi:hypothetical protein